MSEWNKISKIPSQKSDDTEMGAYIMQPQNIQYEKSSSSSKQSGKAQKILRQEIQKVNRTEKNLDDWLLRQDKNSLKLVISKCNIKWL